MVLEWIDWLFIIGFFVLSLGIGLSVMRKAGASSAEFFASGRSMPWWLLGISMVATTFSADTPNLVTDLVRQHGVSGNWLWWAFLITGIVTVFIYSALWRRSGVLTDIEFYEVRYSGRAAAFLRGFRAVYLGLFFNMVIMAAVLLAAIKIGGVMLGFSPLQTVLIMSIIVVVYTMLGGLRGVLITDFLQFGIAMVGSVLAAWYIVNLPEVGGLEGLFTHVNVADSLAMVPDGSNGEELLAIFIIPLAVQWWSVWYPGSEPGGGGYVAQRMLAAKDESNAVGATMLFNVAHYALRPWPWILVALASMVIFPDLESLRQAFPNVPDEIIKNDLAYSAMLTKLPSGLLGLVLASLIAAVMSTISTHLNWGASYLVNDFYCRFVNRDASDKQLVLVGRIIIVILMIVAALLALFLSNALQAFNILLQIGAGTGLLFLLRWFWWRVNAMSELTAMVVSFLMAIYLEIIHPMTGLMALNTWQKLIAGVGVTTFSWILVTLVTRPADMGTLQKFYKLVSPSEKGWGPVIDSLGVEAPMPTTSFPRALAQVFWGLVAIYSTIFATGYWLYGQSLYGTAATVFAMIGAVMLYKLWPQARENVR